MDDEYVFKTAVLNPIGAVHARVEVKSVDLAKYLAPIIEKLPGVHNVFVDTDMIQNKTLVCIVFMYGPTGHEIAVNAGEALVKAIKMLVDFAETMIADADSQAKL